MIRDDGRHQADGLRHRADRRPRAHDRDRAAARLAGVHGARARRGAAARLPHRRVRRRHHALPAGDRAAAVSRARTRTRCSSASPSASSPPATQVNRARRQAARARSSTRRWQREPDDRYADVGRAAARADGRSRRARASSDARAELRALLRRSRRLRARASSRAWSTALTATRARRARRRGAPRRRSSCGAGCWRIEPSNAGAARRWSTASRRTSGARALSSAASRSRGGARSPSAAAGLGARHWLRTHPTTAAGAAHVAGAAGAAAAAPARRTPPIRRRTSRRWSVDAAARSSAVRSTTSRRSCAPAAAPPRTFELAPTPQGGRPSSSTASAWATTGRSSSSWRSAGPTHGALRVALLLPQGRRHRRRRAGGPPGRAAALEAGPPDRQDRARQTPTCWSTAASCTRASRSTSPSPSSPTSARRRWRVERLGARLRSADADASSCAPTISACRAWSLERRGDAATMRLRRALAAAWSSPLRRRSPTRRQPARTRSSGAHRLRSRRLRARHRHHQPAALPDRSSSAPRRRWSRRTSCSRCRYFFVRQAEGGRARGHDAARRCGRATSSIRSSTRPSPCASSKTCAAARTARISALKKRELEERERARKDEERRRAAGARQGRAHLRRSRRREAQPPHRAAPLRRRPVRRTVRRAKAIAFGVDRGRLRGRLGRRATSPCSTATRSTRPPGTSSSRPRTQNTATALITLQLAAGAAFWATVGVGHPRRAAAVQARGRRRHARAPRRRPAEAQDARSLRSFAAPTAASASLGDILMPSLRVTAARQGPEGLSPLQEDHVARPRRGERHRPARSAARRQPRAHPLRRARLQRRVDRQARRSARQRQEAQEAPAGARGRDPDRHRRADVLALRRAGHRRARRPRRWPTLNSYKKLFEFSEKLIAKLRSADAARRADGRRSSQITNADKGFLILLEGRAGRVKVARNLRRENHRRRASASSPTRSSRRSCKTAKAAHRLRRAPRRGVQERDERHEPQAVVGDVRAAARARQPARRASTSATTRWRSCSSESHLRGADRSSRRRRR